MVLQEIFWMTFDLNDVGFQIGINTHIVHSELIMCVILWHTRRTMTSTTIVFALIIKVYVKYSKNRNEIMNGRVWSSLNC